MTGGGDRTLGFVSPVAVGDIGRRELKSIWGEHPRFELPGAHSIRFPSCGPDGRQGSRRGCRTGEPAPRAGPQAPAPPPVPAPTGSPAPNGRACGSIVGGVSWVSRNGAFRILRDSSRHSHPGFSYGWYSAPRFLQLGCAVRCCCQSPVACPLLRHVPTLDRVPPRRGASCGCCRFISRGPMGSAWGGSRSRTARGRLPIGAASISTPPASNRAPAPSSSPPGLPR